MKKILVVEDNELVRKFLSEFLRWRSYKVIEAENGLEGWRLTLEEEPDLVISDIDMPGLNGYELLKKLQQELDESMIPVIFLSGGATADARDLALQLGAADFLSKPTLPDKLLEVISTCLRKNGASNKRFKE
ncbi:MAG: response regulator [Cyanosarcina radialis HA8281-LM2]|jgi:DNA-binding response OmpR family regulator|nr:response regulator [Cyanosarcina radialis HA8281-LM2]